MADSPGTEVRVIGGAKGRGLFALRRFSRGEYIFEERPLVCSQFLWNQAYGYQVCEYCMSPLETAEENIQRLTGNYNLQLPFAECCSTRKDSIVECTDCEETYCCLLCREQAWEEYHRTLCYGCLSDSSKYALEQLKNLWRHVQYPPEAASVMLVASIIATVKQAKDKIGALQLFSEFCHRTVNKEEELAHKLLGDKFQSQIECLRQLISKVFPDVDLQNLFTEESFSSLISLVATNGQGIGTSAFSTWVKNCDALELSSQKRNELEILIETIYMDIKRDNLF